MKIKKHCNCPGEQLTERTLNDLIFEAIQMANKDNRERMLIIEGNTISHIPRLDEFEIKEFRINVLAYVPINAKISDVKLLQNIS